MRKIDSFTHNLASTRAAVEAKGTSRFSARSMTAHRSRQALLTDKTVDTAGQPLLLLLHVSPTDDTQSHPLQILQQYDWNRTTQIPIKHLWSSLKSYSFCCCGHQTTAAPPLFPNRARDQSFVAAKFASACLSQASAPDLPSVWLVYLPRSMDHTECSTPSGLASAAIDGKPKVTLPRSSTPGNLFYVWLGLKHEIHLKKIKKIGLLIFPQQ